MMYYISYMNFQDPPEEAKDALRSARIVSEIAVVTHAPDRDTCKVSENLINTRKKEKRII